MRALNAWRVEEGEKSKERDLFMPWYCVDNESFGAIPETPVAVELRSEKNGFVLSGCVVDRERAGM